jgi:hypothetical protein
MRDRSHPKRLTPPRAHLLAVAVLVGAVLVAGCGGSSPSQTAAGLGGATTSASKPASSGATAPSAGTPGALAYAECMRANGVSNFPDPKAGGGFAFHAPAGVISSPAFRAAQAKCQRFMPGGGPLSPGPPASAQTMAQLRKIAVCMRQHGVPQFPDPRSSVPHGFNPNPAAYREITNYQGAILLYPITIDPQSPAYEQATAACGAGFLAGNNAH